MEGPQAHSRATHERDRKTYLARFRPEDRVLGRTGWLGHFWRAKYGNFSRAPKGGKARRYFSVTAAGQAALRRSEAFAEKIRSGLSEAREMWRTA
jgi:hypothetical protein